ncbi:hypothetical protein F5884DRAFT_839408 [Xylogone sp. PMI_703]|nr:hypothetical protein F5884DRAFT_839408 [Xylogone sp. PMI_703]
MVGVAGRSKGCNTCRQRRVKCDEAKPICRRCIKAGFESPCPPEPPSSAEETTSAIVTNHNRRHGEHRVQRIVPNLVPTRIEIPQQMSLVAFQNDIFFAYIFSNFIWRGYGSIWLEHAAEGRLGPLALDAAKALAQSTFGKSKKVTDVEIQGGIHYGKSLQALAKELGNTRALLLKGETHKLIVPVLVLMMHASTLTDRLAATFHLQGVTKIISLSGPEAFQHQPLLNALEAARTTIVVASLVTRKRVFFDTPAWRSVPWGLDPMAKTPQSYLLDILASVPGILEDMDNYLQSLDNDESFSTQKGLAITSSANERMISVIEDTLPILTTSDKPLYSSITTRVLFQLQTVYRWRWYWQAHFGTDVEVDENITYQANSTMPTNTKPMDSPQLVSRLHFKHSNAAVDIMVYNAVLVWLLALLWELEPLRATSLIEQCASHSMEAVISNYEQDSVLISEFKFSGTPVGISRYTSFEPLTRPGASISVRDAAIEICRAFEWQSRNHGAGREANFMYMFPICMAISVLDADIEGQSWIQVLLDANPFTKGFGGYSRGRMSRDDYTSGKRVERFGQFITREILDTEKESDDTSPGLVHLLLLRGKMDIS